MFDIGTLDQLAEITMGQSPKGSTVSSEGIIPLLNGPKEFGINHPHPVQFTTDPKRFAKKGDLLFCVRGSTGKMNWADQDYAIGRGIAAIREKSPNTLYFIKGAIQSNLRRITNTAIGSVITGIKKDDLFKFECPIPNKKEIIKINEFLGNLFQKIELNQKTNEILEEITERLFKSWFIDFDPVRAKAEKRSIGLSKEICDLFPDQLIDSEIGKIPRGWEYIALKEVFTPRNERAGDREIKEFSSTNDGIQPRDIKFKKNLSSSSSKNKVAYKGDFVFGMSREVLNFGLMSHEIGGFSSAYKVYDVSGDYKFSNFIYRQFLARPHYYYQAVSASSREGQSISQDMLLKLKILSPNELVLSIFNTVIEPILQRCDLILYENQLLEEFIDLLLPKLICGELRIPDAEKFLEEAGI